MAAKSGWASIVLQRSERCIPQMSPCLYPPTTALTARCNLSQRSSMQVIIGELRHFLPFRFADRAAELGLRPLGPPIAPHVVEGPQRE